MNWADKGKRHPNILKSFDFHNIMNTDALFARKFDAAQDAVIPDMIDEHKAHKMDIVLRADG